MHALDFPSPVAPGCTPPPKPERTMHGIDGFDAFEAELARAKTKKLTTSQHARLQAARVVSHRLGLDDDWWPLIVRVRGVIDDADR